MRLDRSTVAFALPLLGNLQSFVSSLSILDTIPSCYLDCLKQSGDVTCNGVDIKCFCQLSNGNFLTNVITCIKSKCDNNLNTNMLVAPVAAVCASEGVPVAPFAIANAISIGSSVNAAPTPIPAGATTITSSFASAGTAFVVAVPISASIGQSGVAIVTGSRSTVKAESITGDSRVSSETRTSSGSRSSSSSSRSSSRSSSSSSSASTTTTASSFTTTTVITTRSASTASPTDGSQGQVIEVAEYSGNGTPFSAASPARQGVNRWLGAGIGFVSLMVLVWV